MIASLVILLAIGTIMSVIALVLDVRGAPSQNRRVPDHKARSVVTSVLTVIAAASLIGSLALASLEDGAMSAATAPPLERMLATTLALALAIVGGGPFAVLLLRLATRGQTRPGAYGGILIPQNGEAFPERRAEALPPRQPARFTLFGRRRRPASPTATHVVGKLPEGSGHAMGTATVEVLRGGTTIGLLERIAIAGAIIAGFPEAVAVVIAIKGVGRFSELAASEAKERFIIGTLASFVWASACALVVR